MLGPIETIRAEDLASDVAWLRRFAGRLVSDDEELDDLTQDAWAAALQKAPAGLDRRGLRAWLARVVRYRVFRSWRDRARRKHHEGMLVPETSSSDPAEELDRQHIQHRLSGLLIGLEEPYLTAIVLRYHQDLSYEEIARRIGVDPVAARKRVSRGIRRLRDRLRRDLGEHEWRGALSLFALQRTAPPRFTRTLPWIAAIALAVTAAGWLALPRTRNEATPWRMPGMLASDDATRPRGAGTLEREALAGLAAFVGRWNNPVGRLGEDTAFSWALEQKSMYIRRYDSSTGEFVGEGLIGWHPELGQLVVTEFLRDRPEAESMLEGSIWFEDGLLCREYLALEPDGTSRAWRHRWTPGSDPDLVTAQIDYMNDFGDWVSLAENELRRQETDEQ